MVEKRKIVDRLIDQFWKQGYLTISRRFGTYLPEPEKIGDFEVDIIAKQRNNYAIGLILSDEDFRNPNLLEKLTYLATRQTKFTNKRVSLFVGINIDLFSRLKAMIKLLSPEARNSIRLIQLDHNNSLPRSNATEKERILFS